MDRPRKETKRDCKIECYETVDLSLSTHNPPLLWFKATYLINKCSLHLRQIIPTFYSFASVKVCFFIYWHINLVWLFNAKSILFFLDEQEWYYLTHRWEDKGVHIFAKSICPKVNVIPRTGVRTRVLRFHSPAFLPLHHWDPHFASV